MTMSRTWRQRLTRGGDYLRRARTVSVALAAVCGLAAAVKVFVLPQHPDTTDVSAIATRVDNQRAAAGDFAADFVAAVLTTPATQRASLQRFVTLSSDLPPPQDVSSAVPAVISTPQVWSVMPAGSVGGAALYSVTITVAERPYASAAPSRGFYRVAVSMWDYAPRALDLPARISDPGPGADVKLTYGHPLNTDSAVYAVISGFITTYLTATGALDRYVVAGSWLTPIGGYHSAVVTTAETDHEVPDNPGPGTLVHVRAAVTAQTSQFATVNFAYPLTVENSGGTWMVADIDLIPQASGEAEPAPVTLSHS
ncbi:MAG: conjugal transfer protein [Mycobacterium sp.]|nr:conjugal transfer protein [Mycobacterium sp.]